LIVPGCSHPSVYCSQSELFYEALKRAGVDAALALVGGPTL